jgi:hypothetical protein
MTPINGLHIEGILLDIDGTIVERSPILMMPLLLG